MSRSLVADLRQASNTIKAAATFGVEEGAFLEEEAEDDFDLVKRLREHARRIESDLISAEQGKG